MFATFLATGFAPFKEHVRNSSWDALELLRPSLPGSVALRRLPVDHRAAHEQLREHLAELAPRAVLCTGLAKGRTFRIELCARQPAALLTEGGDAVARGRWPWGEMRAALDAARVPHIDSEDAGRYVCESTYWSLLGCAGPAAPEFAAFLHVPHESREFPIDRIAEAVQRVILTRLAALPDPGAGS